MLTPTAKGFVDDDGLCRPYVELQGIEPDQAWVDRQEASVGEYLDHNETVPEDIQTLYDLFDGFIAATIAGRKNLRILDVGCGIRKDWPLYVNSLRRAQSETGNIYVGLDPLKYNLQDRDYPFIAGRLEDLPAAFASKFDVFLFSTSLDHFENIEQVANIVSSLAREDAISIFWVGLHDPSLVAEQIGAHSFRKLYASLHPLLFFWRYLQAGLKIPIEYLRLRARRTRLIAGKPLDNLHFHYFTERNLLPNLRHFGNIEHFLHVPGTNSVFVSVRRR